MVCEFCRFTKSQLSLLLIAIFCIFYFLVPAEAQLNFSTGWGKRSIDFDSKLPLFSYLTQKQRAQLQQLQQRQQFYNFLKVKFNFKTVYDVKQC